MSEPARVDPLVPAGFSLFRGGLLYTLGLRIGLVGDDRRLIRLGFALAFLTWVPLAVLNTLDRAMGGSSIIPFWESVGTHVRLLVTIPLFFLRDGDDLVVCNVRPPSERPNPWPLNVRTNPNVSVRIGRVTEQRVAREARGQEVEKYWPLLVKTWPAYERFFADTHERAIFVLQRQ